MNDNDIKDNLLEDFRILLSKEERTRDTLDSIKTSVDEFTRNHIVAIIEDLFRKKLSKKEINFLIHSIPEHKVAKFFQKTWYGSDKYTKSFVFNTVNLNVRRDETLATLTEKVDKLCELVKREYSISVTNSRAINTDPRSTEEKLKHLEEKQAKLNEQISNLRKKL